MSFWYGDMLNVILESDFSIIKKIPCGADISAEKLLIKFKKTHENFFYDSYPLLNRSKKSLYFGFFG